LIGGDCTGAGVVVVGGVVAVEDDGSVAVVGGCIVCVGIEVGTVQLATMSKRTRR
jgi:hypothetical protein